MTLLISKTQRVDHLFWFYIINQIKVHAKSAIMSVSMHPLWYCFWTWEVYCWSIWQITNWSSGSDISSRRTCSQILSGRSNQENTWSIPQRSEKILIAMATGSGKTKVAFQTVWKLYNARNIRKVLFITDRNFSYKMLLTSLNLFFEKKEAADVIENQKTPKNRDIFCNISVSHFMKLSQQIGLTWNMNQTILIL